MGFFEKLKRGTGLDTTVAPETVDSPAGRDEGWLDVDIEPPAKEAVTCRIQFSRPVSPSGTSLFETPQEAGSWPIVRALLEMPGVHSVIGKGDLLVVARHGDAQWSTLLGSFEAVLGAALDGHAPSSGQSAPAPGDPGTSQALRDQIQQIIDDQINPSLASHGGYIDLLGVEQTRVFIHMGGGCQGCAMSSATLKHGVETTLRAEFPEITEILDTTDHAAGENPYFTG